MLEFFGGQIFFLSSMIFHLVLFGLPFGFLSSYVKKRDDNNSERNSLIVIFSSMFISAGAVVYIHIFNPQVKNIFYAKLFTYPALELKFDFSNRISSNQSSEILKALVKEFPDSRYESPARNYRSKNSGSSSGIRSSAKYIPNYWEVRDNSFYFYLGKSAAKERLDAISGVLEARFSNQKPLLLNSISIKRIDESFPVRFYFENLNKGVLPSEADELSHSINLESYDIKQAKLSDELSRCYIRFSLDDQYWANKIGEFTQFLNKDKVARSSFGIDKDNTDEEIYKIASEFIMRLKYKVTFSNDFTFPAKIYIDKNRNSNVVVVLEESVNPGYLTEERCQKIAFAAFPSLMHTYVKKALLVYVPDNLNIKKVSATRVRFSPFYSSAIAVSQE